MPGIGLGEMLMIVMVAIVLLRPEDLPSLFRQAGKLYREIQKHYLRFKELTQESFDDVIKQERITQDGHSTISNISSVSDPGGDNLEKRHNKNGDTRR